MAGNKPASGGAALIWTVGAPALFVFLWSSGFVATKLALPYAAPLTLLTLRFALAAGLLLVMALVAGAPWPQRWSQVGHYAVAGLLIHGINLGGVFVGLSLGVEAGVAALIVSTQPLLIAAFAGAVLGERVVARQWLGLAIGLVGVVLVLYRKLGYGIGDVWGVVTCVVSLFCITSGTLYQKRFGGGMDLRTGNVIQYTAAGLVTGAVALLTEDMHIAWTAEFVLSLLWLVLVLSLGAISLFYQLIRRGAAARVSSLFFLVPPTTALLAWPTLGETFGPLALAGMALTVAGVALASQPASPQG